MGILEKFKEEVKEEILNDMFVGALSDHELSDIQVWLVGSTVNGVDSDMITINARISINGEIKKYSDSFKNSSNVWSEIGKFIFDKVARDIALSITNSDGMKEFVTSMTKAQKKGI